MPLMPIAFLSLGSNLGDRESMLTVARERIMDTFTGVRFSAIYETEPVEMKDQPWFLNQVVEMKTGISPELLLQWANQLESEMGRQRDIPKGPRTLDIDILLYDDQVLDLPHLSVPHPMMLLRRHVLKPLDDLAPEQRIPPTGITVHDALARCPDHTAIRKTGPC